MANIGTLDRIARAVIGLALIVLPLLLADGTALGVWRWILPVAGLVLLGTAAIRFCPLYTLLGIRTCPIQRG